MRLLLFTPVLYPFHIDILNELFKKGVEARIITQGIFGNYPFENFLKKVQKLSCLKILGTELTDFRAIVGILQFKPDCVIIFGIEKMAGIITFFSTLLARALPIVIVEENNVTVLDGIFKQLLQKIRIALTRSVYFKTPVLIAESDASLKYVTCILKIKRKNKTYVKVHGVNVNRYLPIDKQKSLDFLIKAYGFSNKINGKIRILFVGESSYHKGADILIDAITAFNSLLSDSEKVVFLMPSKGDIFKNKLIVNKICELINKCSLILYPAIKNCDMPLLYNSADIIVLPSRFFNDRSSDRSPNSALEALSCGKILVASAVGGIPTIIGDSALLIEPNNSTVLAMKFFDIVNNLNYYSKFQVKARNRAINNLSIESYVNFLVSIVK